MVAGIATATRSRRADPRGPWTNEGGGPDRARRFFSPLVFYFGVAAHSPEVLTDALPLALALAFASACTGEEKCRGCEASAGFVPVGFSEPVRLPAASPFALACLLTAGVTGSDGVAGSDAAGSDGVAGIEGA